MTKRIAALLLAFLFCAVGPALAREEESSSLTGMVTAISPSGVSVRWENGNVYAFFLDGSEDTSLLAGDLIPGQVVTLRYEGAVNWETADTSAAHVISIESAALDVPYGVILEEFSLVADYDGDGQLEEARLTWNGRGDLGPTATIEIGSASFVSEIYSQAHALVCDLDPEDGRLDILLSGDVMSDDFVTWRIQYAGGGFQQVGQELNGRVEDFSDGFVSLGAWIDVLGTHWGEAAYALDETGQLALPEDSEWYIDESYDPDVYASKAISPIAPLPVTLLTDEGEVASSLPAGSRLHIVSSDLATAAWFETDDGQFGYIRISPSQKGWGLDVAGQDESVYFDYLPYSG